jgi:hypothetical protein
MGNPKFVQAFRQARQARRNIVCALLVRWKLAC